MKFCKAKIVYLPEGIGGTIPNTKPIETECVNNSLLPTFSSSSSSASSDGYNDDDEWTTHIEVIEKYKDKGKEKKSNNPNDAHRGRSVRSNGIDDEREKMVKQHEFWEQLQICDTQIEDKNENENENEKEGTLMDDTKSAVTAMEFCKAKIVYLPEGIGGTIPNTKHIETEYVNNSLLPTFSSSSSSTSSDGYNDDVEWTTHIEVIEKYKDKNKDKDKGKEKKSSNPNDAHRGRSIRSNCIDDEQEKMVKQNEFWEQL